MLPFVFVPLPEFEPAEEFGFFVGEFFVRSVGAALFFLRTLARVLHRQRRGDDQHFRQTAFLAGGDDHPRHLGIEWHGGQLLTQRGE